jgi:CRP/FNR family transcriptional regulator
VTGAKALHICRPQTLFADTRCEGCVVRRTLEGGELPAADLEQLLQRSETVTVRAKQTLYEQGAPAEALFMIRRGAVKMLVSESGLPPQLVRWMTAGNVIGLEAVTGGCYRHSAVAIEPLECCRIPQAVAGFLEENACRGFYRAVLSQYQAACEGADSFVATLRGGTPEQKMARLLLTLGAMHGGRHCVSLLRTDIGAALGLSMETASRLMAEFRRRGLVKATGRQLHCDRDTLSKIAAGG